MLNIVQTSEEELIKQCVRNKSQAQRQMFDKYSSIMFGICLRYIKEPAQAEEVMIIGFTKLFEKIGQFRFEGSFEGWVKRLMVNEALSYLRKNKYMYLEVDIETVHKEPNYSKLDDHLQVDDLMKLIQGLPVGYRTVFNLFAIEGYSHKEIAEKLKISENTSKSQLSRARMLLQKQLLESENNLKSKISSHE